MARNVVLKYPNETIIEVDKLCSFYIKGTDKKYLLYTTNEMENDNVFVYFGALKQVNNKYEMTAIPKDALADFKSILVSIAKGLELDENVSFDTLSLNEKTIIVTGGGKTKIELAKIEKYLSKIEIEEIEEIDFDDLFEEETEIIEEKEIEPVPTKEVKKEAEVIIEEPVQTTLESNQNEESLEPDENIIWDNSVEEDEVTEKHEETKEENENLVKLVEEVKAKKETKKGVSPIVIVAILVILAVLTFLGISWIKENNRKADEENEVNSNVDFTLSLDQIGQKLRASSFVREHTGSGSEVLITTTSTNLIVNIDGELEYRYTLYNNILSTEFDKKDAEGLSLSHHLYAGIQELLGNQRSEILRYITSNYLNSTINKNGILYTKNGDNYKVDIHIGLKGIIPPITLNGPIEEKLFETYKEQLTNEEPLTLQYGTLYFEKYINSNKNIEIIIFEQEPLTYRSYETFVNFLGIAYGEEVKNKFKEEYKGIEDEDKDLDNFKISLNSELESTYKDRYRTENYDWFVVEILNSNEE